MIMGYRLVNYFSRKNKHDMREYFLLITVFNVYWTKLHSMDRKNVTHLVLNIIAANGERGKKEKYDNK